MNKITMGILFFLIGYSIGITIKVADEIKEVARLEGVVKSTIKTHNEKNHDLNACKNDVDFLNDVVKEMGEKCNFQ